MPSLRIETNVALEADQARDLVAKATSLVADVLEKSERYVMVIIHPGVVMAMGAEAGEPAAYVSLVSLGLPEGAPTRLVEGLCGLLEAQANIPQDRVFVELRDHPRTLFGYNGKPFA